METIGCASSGAAEYFFVSLYRVGFPSDSSIARSRSRPQAR